MSRNTTYAALQPLPRSRRHRQLFSILYRQNQDQREKFMGTLGVPEYDT